MPHAPSFLYTFGSYLAELKLPPPVHKVQTSWSAQNLYPPDLCSLFPTPLLINLAPLKPVNHLPMPECPMQFHASVNSRVPPTCMLGMVWVVFLHSLILFPVYRMSYPNLSPWKTSHASKSQYTVPIILALLVRTNQVIFCALNQIYCIVLMLLCQ